MRRDKFGRRCNKKGEPIDKPQEPRQDVIERIVDEYLESKEFDQFIEEKVEEMLREGKLP